MVLRAPAKFVVTGTCSIILPHISGHINSSLEYPTQKPGNVQLLTNFQEKKGAKLPVSPAQQIR